LKRLLIVFEVTAVQVKDEVFGRMRISFEFSISSGCFQDQVHRKGAEFAKGEFFVLSGERPESTNPKPLDLPEFIRRRPFFPCRPLTGKGKDVSSATSAPLR
jgi:hypothetical protein